MVEQFSLANCWVCIPLSGKKKKQLYTDYMAFIWIMKHLLGEFLGTLQKNSAKWRVFLVENYLYKTIYLAQKYGLSMVYHPDPEHRT